MKDYNMTVHYRRLNEAIYKMMPSTTNDTIYEMMKAKPVKDTEEFYKFLTDEQIEFISSYGSVMPEDFVKYSKNIWVYSDDFIMIKIPGTLPEDSTYYSHSINSIKTYIRDKKIEKILR